MVNGASSHSVGRMRMDSSRDGRGWSCLEVKISTVENERCAGKQSERELESTMWVLDEGVNMTSDSGTPSVRSCSVEVWAFDVSALGATETKT